MKTIKTLAAVIFFNLAFLTFSNGLLAQGTILLSTKTVETGPGATIFSFNTATDSTAVLWNFPSRIAIVGNLVYCPANNLFYAITATPNGYDSAAIISFNPATKGVTTVFNFSTASAVFTNLVYNTSKGLFYGETYTDGTNQNGTIFSFNPLTNAEKVVWQFGSSAYYPLGKLVYDSKNGLYYGTTYYGGNYFGTIFSFNPATNAVTEVFDYDYYTDGDGAYNILSFDPGSNLIYSVDNITRTSFSFDPATSSIKVLHAASDTTSVSGPFDYMSYDPVNGQFYAAVPGNSSEEIYNFNPITNKDSLVWSGNFPDYDDVSNTMLYNTVDGVFYGLTTERPGILSFNPATNTEKNLLALPDVVESYSSFVAYTPVTGSGSINTGVISPASYCAGGTIKVPYTLTGTVNSTNIFTAQLSDASGSFANPVNIGTLASAAAGTITATIPATTPIGAGYRVRVLSSFPILTNSNNGSNITIGRVPVVSAGSLTQCIGVKGTLLAAGATTYTWQPATGLSATTGASVTASPSVTTTYTVTGTNTCGTAKATALDSVTQLLTVTAKAGQGTDANDFEASWKSVSNVTGYYLDVSVHSNFSSYSTGYNNLSVGNVTNTTVTGLTPGTTYYYRVRAANSCGVGPNSATITYATSACGSAQAETIYPASFLICHNDSIKLTLTPKPFVITQWQISTDNINWANVSYGNNNSGSYTTHRADATGRKYYRCLIGPCAPFATNSVIVDVSEPVIPIKFSAVTDTSVTLNWGPTGSNVAFQIGYSGTTSKFLGSTYLEPYTIKGLSAGGNYAVTVTQINLQYCPAAGTDSLKILCAAPTGLNVTASTTNSISVSWAGPTGNYRIYYTQLFSSSTVTKTMDVINTTSATIGSLLPGGTFQIYVRSLNCDSIPGQPSAFIMGSTSAATTCTGAPVIDSVKSTCNQQLQIWLHGGSVGQYKIYLQAIGPVMQPVSTYSISGGNLTANVMPGQTYLVAAATACYGVNSQLSVWPQPVIISGACGALGNLVLNQPACAGFTASWNPDNCVGSTLKAYSLYIRKQGAISWGSYNILPPTYGNPFKQISSLLPGTTYQCFVRSAYSCGNYLVYGPASQIQTIATLTSGCRVEDEQTTQEEATSPIAIATNTEESFSLYPNPNTGEFVVDFSRLNTDEEQVRIEVINVLGQTVLTHITSVAGGHLNEFITLPSGSASGIYFVRLIAGNKVYNTEMNVSR